MTNKVEGVYPTVEDATIAINRLKDEGYSREDITLVANPETRDKLKVEVDLEVTDLDRYENAPVHDFRDAVLQGGVAVLLSEEATGPSDPSRQANVQPNTVGPEGTRDYEEEQAVDSQGSQPRKDHELTTDELESYEKKH